MEVPIVVLYKCSLRVVSRSNVSDGAHKEPMSYNIPESLMPGYTTYNLRVFCFQGSDFGSKGKHASSGGGVIWTDDYSVSLSIGKNEVATAFKSYTDGSVDWLELCDAPIWFYQVIWKIYLTHLSLFIRVALRLLRVLHTCAFLQ